MTDDATNPATPTQDATRDTANVVIHPPILWFILVLFWGLDWLLALPFVPPAWPNLWIGGGLFILGIASAGWAFRQFPDLRDDLDTHRPSTRIVQSGPFRFSRNPIYIGMFLGLVGIAVAVNSLWVILGLGLWYPVMRYGVIGREEAYLERKFGEEYLTYKSRVRRWI